MARTTMKREKGKLVRERHYAGKGLVWYITWSNGESLNTYYDASSRGGYRKANMERLLGNKLYRWI